MHSVYLVNWYNAHPIDIHLQTQSLDIVTVTLGVILVDKLMTKSYTNMVLLNASMSIFSDMLASAFGTLHRITS